MAPAEEPATIAAMKMLYFSVTLMIALLGATAYLALQARDEAVKANVKMDLLTQQQRAVAASQPVVVQMPPPESPPATVAPVAPHVAPVPTLAADSPAPGGSRPAGSLSTAPAPALDMPPATAPAGSPAITAAPAVEAPLTPAQRLVKSAPSIARVKEFVPDQGFVVLSAGSKQGLTEGAKFDLRRDASIVGRIKISGVDTAESIANVDSRSVPAGVTIRAGDEVIGMVRQN